jgi:flagellin-like protein
MVVRKGVSPVIAAVLLIAATVTIGILFTTWATHWTSEQISSQTSTCSINTNYLIERVEFNKSGDNQMLIKITNKGTHDLYGFGVVLDNGTKVVNINSSDPLINQGNITELVPLREEQSAYIRLNLSVNYTNLGKTVTDVRVLNDACSVVSKRTITITKY